MDTYQEYLNSLKEPEDEEEVVNTYQEYQDFISKTPSQRAGEEIKEKRPPLERAREFVSDIFKKKELEDEVQLPPPAVTETSSPVIDYANNTLARVLEDKYTKLRFEQEKPEPRQKRMDSLSDDIREVEEAMSYPTASSNSFSSKWLVVNKYESGRGIDDIKVALVGWAKNMFDSVASVFEVDIQKKEEFAEKQETIIKKGFEDLNVPEEQRAGILERFSPRVERQRLEEGRVPFQEAMQQYVDDVSPTNPTFADQLIQGIGSMAGFYIASMVTFGGPAVPTVLESLGEAGAVYEENKKRGQEPSEAFVGSSKTFAENLVWNAVLNHWGGLFDDIGKPAVKTIKKKVLASVRASAAEGIQEAGQQLLSNVNTGKTGTEVWEGVFESFAIGAIIGAGAKGVEVTTGGEVAPIIRKETRTAKEIVEKGGTVGEAQQAIQATDLTRYEKAINESDAKTLFELGRKHEGDTRFQVHKTLGIEEPSVEKPPITAEKTTPEEEKEKVPTTTPQPVEKVSTTTFEPLTKEREKEIMKPDKDIFHGSPVSIDQIRQEGFKFYNIPSIGEVMEFTDDPKRALEEYGMGNKENVLNTKVGDFNWKIFDSRKDEQLFVEEMGTPDLASAINKEGEYDGFIVHQDYGDGIVYALTNKGKVSSLLKGTLKVKPQPTEPLIEEKVKKASELGTEAFKEGERLPLLDKGLTSILQGIPEGKTTQKIIKAWTDSYDKAAAKATAPEPQPKPVEPTMIEPSQAEAALRHQIGDTFEVVKPVYDLWKSKGRTIFIRPTEVRLGYSSWLEQKNFIDSVQEAGGNNVYKVVVSEKAIKTTPEEAKTPKPTPEPKVTKKAVGVAKEIGGIIKEDVSDVARVVEERYGEGKSLASLTVSQLEKAIPEGKVIVYTDKLASKFGARTRGIDFGVLEERYALLYGGVSEGVFTDGYVLILDKQAASEVNEENIKRQTNVFRKQQMKDLGFSHDDAQKLAEDNVKEGIKAAEGSFPEYKKLIPDLDTMEKAEIIGISTMGGQPVYILKSDSHVVTASADKVQFMLKTLGDVDIHIKLPENPIAFSKRKKISGIVAPVLGGEEDIVQRVEKAYEKPEPKPKTQGVSGSQAAIGDEYASLEELRETFGNVPKVEFPELVRLAKEITQNEVSVKIPRRRALGVPLGVARTGGESKEIVLNPTIFKDVELMSKVLAHEIGHITDYIPDNTHARGNLIGKIASLQGFLRHTFTNLKTEQKLDNLVREQKDLQQQRRDLKDKDGEVPPSLEVRDELVLAKLKRVNKEIARLRESPTLKNDVIFQELKTLTQLWKPFDDSNAKAAEYRYSGDELYADAISVLFNMPSLLETTAPSFYKGFFENLDAKPEAEENFYALWNLVYRGAEAVSSERHKEIREMFDKGEDIHRSLLEEKKMRDKEYVFRLKYELIDKNQRVIDKVNQARREGKPVADDQNPVFWLEGHNYVGGIVKNYMENNIQPIYKKIQESELTWEDVGEVLFLERVVKERGDIKNPIGQVRKLDPNLYEAVEDRIPTQIAALEKKTTTDQLKFLEKEFGDVISEDGRSLYSEIIALFPKGIANPLGTTSESAQQSLSYLKSQLGVKKWGVLMEAIEEFRGATNLITQMAKKEGFWKPELIKEIEANPAYATFQVLDYLQETIPASIMHQVGTLKEIANPADATTTKSVSIIRAIERNKVKKKIVEFMKTNFPEEIQEARYTFTGRKRIPLEPKDRKLSLFTTIEDGSLKGYYVDPYIAKTMEYSSTGNLHAVVEVFRLFNSKLFRPMFITFNVGFQSYNLFRDFFRFYKNIPTMTIPRALKAYKNALTPSVRRSWGVPDPVIAEMEKNKLLSVTYNDVIRGATTEDARIDVLLARTGVSPLKGKQRPAILRPILAMLDVIEKTGNFIETIPKVAGYQELQGVYPSEKLGHTIRTRVGSPDFLRKGASYSTYNEIFLFSNAIKEGIRSDVAVATEPETRAGWWFKTAQVNLLPKLIMWAGLLGFFGDKIKEMLEDVSEYDKTNYIIIPVGEDKNGKTVYIRVPSDETGRLVGGVFWKILRASSNNTPILQDLSDILSFTGGQLPSLTPIIDSVSASTQFLAGKNPYDYFRGRPVIPEKEFEAGGMYALRPFVNWQLQTLGLGTIWRGYVSQQAPETKTWTQKLVETPVLSNILGRWLKVSDYGKTEMNRRIVQNEERENAKRLLEERRKLDEAVREYRDGDQSLSRRLAAERQLVKDVVGKPPYSGTRKAKATNTKKKFRIAIIKGTADANVTSLIYANTNAEKTALLKEIKEDMSVSEFSKLKRMLIDEKIVSKNVFNELRK